MNFNGRPTTTYGKINTHTLSKLFNVHRRTIKRWIKAGLFDPSDMESIYHYYTSRLKKKNKNK